MTPNNLKLRPGLFLVSILALVIIASSYYLFSKRANSCELLAEDTANNHFTYQYRGRKISGIGWYHGTAERAAAEVTSAEAILAGQKKQCREAGQVLERYLTKYSAQRKEAQRALDTLEKIYSTHPFDVIGLELSPLQYNDTFIEPDTQEDLSQRIVPLFESLCPEETRRFIEVALVFPGAEFEFARRRPGRIQLVPMGEDSLVVASFKALSPESREFAQHVHEMKPEEIQAYDRYFEMNKAGRALSEAEIEELISKLKDPGKSKLRKYFTEFSQVMRLMDQRNRHMVDLALASGKDVAIMVGNYHIPGLRKELEQRCKSGH